jgi:integrase
MAACNCRPTWQAMVKGRFKGDRPVRKNFSTRAEAVAWRTEAARAVSRGEMKAPTKVTVREAGEQLVKDMRSGKALTRSETPYKPSAIRSYERALRLRVYPRLGPVKLSDVTRRDMQDFVDGLRVKGLSGSTIRNTLDPLRVVFKEAALDGVVGVDPMKALRVPPADSGGRERIPASHEVPGIVAALPDDDAENTRLLYLVAYRHGLRRGELRELRFSDVDLDDETISVTRALDDDEGVISTKTLAGERVVPLLAETVQGLRAHMMRSGRRGDDLVFGTTATQPFTPSTIRRRAIKAWKAARLLEYDADGKPLPFGLHEGRHAAVVAMRAAGIDPETRMAIVGHSSAESHARYARHVQAEHRRAAMAKLRDHLAATAEGSS